MVPLCKKAFSFLLASLVFSPVAALAQSQPTGAINQQDEVVLIQLDPNEDAGRVLQILRSDDKFETNQYITRIFELRNTEAYEARNIIREAVSLEKGVVRAARTQPRDGSPPRFFLAVTTTPAQMPTIAQAIETIDIPGFVNSQGRSREAIRLRHRRASEMETILRNTRATSQTRFFADDLTNTIYFDDSRTVATAIIPFVEFFDVPAPQIEFDVKIIELREDNSRQIGLDWDAWKNTVGGTTTFAGGILEGGNRFGRLDILLSLDTASLASFLNYTVQTGNARLAQRSRLNASNLTPAIISDVRRIPFYDFQRTERTPTVLLSDINEIGSLKTVVPQVTNELVDLSSETEGLLIRISPVIGTDMVSARIDISLNTLTGFDRRQRPIVTEQNLTNLFTLRDGEQILLGTLERERNVTSRRGIPGLKELPVLRNLFSVENSRADRSRIFILATPRFSRAAFEARTMREQANGTAVLRFSDTPPTDWRDAGFNQLESQLETSID